MASLAAHCIRTLTSLSTALLRPGSDPASLRRLRAVYRLGKRLPRVAGVRWEPIKAYGVPAEWFVPTVAQSAAALLYLHGGSWVLGLTGAHRTLSAHLARLTGLRVLAVDYRLAPEHPYPAALEDALAAFKWLGAQGYAADRLGLVGSSAGANLAVALALARKQHGRPQPGAIAALSGVFDLTEREAGADSSKKVMLTAR